MENTVAVGAKFWSFDWGQAWTSEVALVHGKTLAYLVGDEIKVVALDRCFLKESEAWEEMSRKAFEEAQKNAEQARNHWNSAKKAREKGD